MKNIDISYRKKMIFYCSAFVRAMIGTNNDEILCLPANGFHCPAWKWKVPNQILGKKSEIRNTATWNQNHVKASKKGKYQEIGKMMLEISVVIDCSRFNVVFLHTETFETRNTNKAILVKIFHIFKMITVWICRTLLSKSFF